MRDRYERKFDREKETKNTVRFQERVPDGELPVIGSLYIQKHALPTGIETITIVIDTVES